MLDLEENGCPQVETTDTLIDNELPSNDQESAVDQNCTQSDEEVTNQNTSEVVPVTPVTDEDIPSRYQVRDETSRWNGPFTARMKVARTFVLVTLKKCDTEETQSFYIPVRW